MENKDEKYLNDLLKERSGGEDDGSSGFKVPANYFDELPYKVSEKKGVQRTKGFYWAWTTPAIGLTCVLLALFIFDKEEQYTGYYSGKVEIEDLNYEYIEDEVSEEEVIDFIIDEGGDFNY